MGAGASSYDRPQLLGPPYTEYNSMFYSGAFQGSDFTKEDYIELERRFMEQLVNKECFLGISKSTDPTVLIVAPYPTEPLPTCKGIASATDYTTALSYRWDNLANAANFEASWEMRFDSLLSTGFYCIPDSDPMFHRLDKLLELLQNPRNKLRRDGMALLWVDQFCIPQNRSRTMDVVMNGVDLYQTGGYLIHVNADMSALTQHMQNLEQTHRSRMSQYGNDFLEVMSEDEQMTFFNVCLQSGFPVYLYQLLNRGWICRETSYGQGCLGIVADTTLIKKHMLEVLGQLFFKLLVQQKVPSDYLVVVQEISEDLTRFAKTSHSQFMEWLRPLDTTARILCAEFTNDDDRAINLQLAQAAEFSYQTRAAATESEKQQLNELIDITGMLVPGENCPFYAVIAYNFHRSKLDDQALAELLQNLKTARDRYLAEGKTVLLSTLGKYLAMVAERPSWLCMMNKLKGSDMEQKRGNAFKIVDYLRTCKNWDDRDDFYNYSSLTSDKKNTSHRFGIMIANVGESQYQLYITVVDTDDVGDDVTLDDLCADVWNTIEGMNSYGKGHITVLC